jgi:hypothetical protein
MQRIPLSDPIAIQIIPEDGRSGPGLDFDCFGRGTVFVDAFEGIAEFRFDGTVDAGENGVAPGAIGDEVDEEGGKTIPEILKVGMIIVEPIVMFTILLAFGVSAISLALGGLVPHDLEIFQVPEGDVALKFSGPLLDTSNDFELGLLIWFGQEGGIRTAIGRVFLIHIRIANNRRLLEQRISARVSEIGAICWEYAIARRACAS